MSTILYPYGVPVTLADSKGGPTKTNNKGGNGKGIGPGGGNGIGKGKGQGGGGNPSSGGGGGEFTPTGSPMFIFDTANVSGSTLPDDSGLSRDLTLTGTTSGTVGGVANALTFNGTSDIAKSGALSTFGVQAIGFAFYTPNTITFANGDSHLLNLSSGGQSEQRHIISLGVSHSTPSSEVITVWGRGGAGNAHFSYLNASSLPSIAIGWHVLIVNFDSGNNKWDIYIDGVDEYTEVTVRLGTDPAEWTLSDQIVIGLDDTTMGGGADDYFEGSLRKIMAYDTALTSGELSDFYTHLNSYIA